MFRSAVDLLTDLISYDLDEFAYYRSSAILSLILTRMVQSVVRPTLQMLPGIGKKNSAIPRIQ